MDHEACLAWSELEQKETAKRKVVCDVISPVRGSATAAAAPVGKEYQNLTFWVLSKRTTSYGTEYVCDVECTRGPGGSLSV